MHILKRFGTSYRAEEKHTEKRKEQTKIVRNIYCSDIIAIENLQPIMAV